MITRILVLLFAFTLSAYAQSGCTGCGLFGIPVVANDEVFVGTGPATGGFIALDSGGAVSFNGTAFSQADLTNLASSTSAELLALISDETGTGKAVFATAPTFLTSLTTPIVISADADPADAGFLRLGNTELIGWEAATPGADLTLLVDASDILQASGAFNVGGALTVGTNAVPDSTNDLSFFSATSSAQLLALLSNPTGTGLAVFATAPTFTTSILTPIMISGDADPADAGVVRMGNTELLAWEAATPGTDLTLGVDASDILQASGAVNVGGALTEGTNAVPNDTDTLDFFAPTTSAELLGTISDEVGTGPLVFNISPTIVTPTIASFTNSAHDHADAAGGGVVVIAALPTITGTATWDPPNMASDGSVQATTVTATGCAVGDPAFASHPAIGVNDVLISAHVESANTIRVILLNKTGSGINVATGTVRASCWQY